MCTCQEKTIAEMINTPIEGMIVRKARIVPMRVTFSFEGSSQRKSYPIECRYCPQCGSEMYGEGQKPSKDLLRM